ncbi:glycosyltransferase family 2 protein [Nonlabens sp.]|uniref:glycosyltransferase family 2 protein n=1 Tax=Nonlabens sp. TaxID=1888209 RepID=UPI003F69CDF8
MYKISIITINYNNASGLKKTLESIAVNSQKIDVQLIVIDGGSSDGSVEVMNSFTDIITYSISEPDKSVYDAMNKGIEKSSGDYILFLNSGDHFYADSSLEQAMPQLTVEDIIAYDIELVGVQKRIKKHPDFIKASFLFKQTLAHQSVFINRDVFSKVGLYDTSLKITADWKLFIDAIIKNQATYKAVHQVLSTYYMDGMSSTTAGLQLGQQEREFILRRDYALFYEDYEQLNYMNIPRFKLLKTLENTSIRRKLTTAWLRVLTWLG